MIDIVIACLKEPERVQRLGTLIKMITEHTKLDYNIIILINKESSACNKNKGLKLSGGSHICFLDDDIIIKQDGWLGLMIETLQKYPEAGAIVPRLTYPDGKWQNLTSDVSDIREVKGSSCSACLLCRKGIAQFDEQFKGAWAEDEDFFMQLEAKGYKVLCDGRVNIHHLAQHNKPIKENEEYLVKKWGRRRS